MRLSSHLEVMQECGDCQLKSSAFFCQLSPGAVKAFEDVKLAGVYPRGATLFFEGENPRGVYLLCRGRVKLSVCSADGRVLILRIAGPGELLGLSAAVSDLPYKATAEAIEPCQVSFVRKEEFLRFLGEHAEACFKIAQLLSRNYHAAYMQIRSLGLSNSALEKLAKLLLDWCDGSGKGTEQGIRLKLGLTHEEIAEMIGSSRETVSRLFSELKVRQTICTQGSTLIVRDKAALESLMSF
jgi:CRP/FNR family transcriptional regulator, cyclic AMP receptor protein